MTKQLTPLERQRLRYEERERKVLECRRLRDQGMRQCDIARKLELSQATVWAYLQMTEPAKAAS